MIVNNFVPNNNIFKGFKENTSLNVENNSFSEVIKENLNKINKKQLEADEITEKFINGDENTDIHDVMISAEEAKLSLQLAVQVRNKILEAVQEMNRMQI